MWFRLFNSCVDTEGEGMKKLIIVCLLLFAGQALAENYYDYIRLPRNNPAPYTRNDTIDSSQSGMTIADEVIWRTRKIQEWAASGEICRVIGHRWEKVDLGFMLHSDAQKRPEKRRCSICDQMESREMKEWRVCP